jgi:hypothetical protein
MVERLLVHGRYVDRTFIPDIPLPDAEGAAELIITCTAPQTQVSIAAAFGTATNLRSEQEILAQLRSDRDEWGDR